MSIALVKEGIDQVGNPKHRDECTDPDALMSAHYFGGQQYQELADILGLPIGTVKKQLHRAKARLRMRLEQGQGAREF